MGLTHRGYFSDTPFVQTKSEVLCFSTLPLVVQIVLLKIIVDMDKWDK